MGIARGAAEGSAQGAADEVHLDDNGGITARGRKPNGRCACKLVLTIAHHCSQVSHGMR